jgi:tRNA(His) 5'-end guanylyltransferase
VFDARVFVLPEADVCNYFVWRQQDAQRNAVQMIARAMFSHKECHLKSCPDLRLMTEDPRIHEHGLLIAGHFM